MAIAGSSANSPFFQPGPEEIGLTGQELVEVFVQVRGIRKQFVTTAQIASLAGAGSGTDANVTATGATQGTAYQIIQTVTIVDTCPPGAGVILPIWSASAAFLVLSRGANDLQLYPDAGSQIETIGVNSPIPIIVGGGAWFYADTPGVWRSA